MTEEIKILIEDAIVEFGLNSYTVLLTGSTINAKKFEDVTDIDLVIIGDSFGRKTISNRQYRGFEFDLIFFSTRGLKYLHQFDNNGANFISLNMLANSALVTGNRLLYKNIKKQAANILKSKKRDLTSSSLSNLCEEVFKILEALQNSKKLESKIFHRNELFLTICELLIIVNYGWTIRSKQKIKFLLKLNNHNFNRLIEQLNCRVSTKNIQIISAITLSISKQINLSFEKKTYQKFSTLSNTKIIILSFFSEKAKYLEDMLAGINFSSLNIYTFNLNKPIENNFLCYIDNTTQSIDIEYVEKLFLENPPKKNVFIQKIEYLSSFIDENFYFSNKSTYFSDEFAGHLIKSISYVSRTHKLDTSITLFIYLVEFINIISKYQKDTHNYLNELWLDYLVFVTDASEEFVSYQLTELTIKSRFEEFFIEQKEVLQFSLQFYNEKIYKDLITKESHKEIIAYLARSFAYIPKKWISEKINNYFRLIFLLHGVKKDQYSYYLYMVTRYYENMKSPILSY